MTSNLLTLNSSETEFLFVRLKQQLAKLLAILTSFLMKILRSLIDYQHSPSCYYHICQLHCIHPYLDFKTANTIATLYIPNLTTVTLCTSTFLRLR